MKKKLFALTAVLVIFTLGITTTFLLLPYLCDNFLLPQLVKNLPFSTNEMSISKLTLWKTRGTINLKKDGQQILSIPRFELHYSPSSLLKSTIDTIMLDSLFLHIKIVKGRPIITGFNDVNSKSKSTAKTNPIVLPFAVNRVLLQNCTIVLSAEEKETSKNLNFLIDGQIAFKFAEDGKPRKQLTEVISTLTTRGDLALSAEINALFSKELQEVSTQLQLPNLKNINDLVTLFAIGTDFDLSGKGLLYTTIKTKDFSTVSEYQTTANLTGLQLIQGGATFKTPSHQQTTIKIHGDNNKGTYHIQNLSLSEPEPIQMQLKGKYSIDNKSLTGNGTLTPGRIEQTFALSYQVTLTGTSPQLDYTLQAKQFAIDDTFLVKAPYLRGSVTGLGLDSKITGALSCTVDKITDTTKKLAATNIRLNMPFEIPAPSKPQKKSGYFTIGSLEYKNKDSATLETTLWQTATGISFDSVITSPFIEEFSLACNGDAQLNQDIHLECTLPETFFESSTFPSYLPIDNSISMSGTLSATGEIAYLGKNFEGFFTTTLSGGNLQSTEVSLSGIDMQIHLPDITEIQSSPGQLSTIEEIQLGKIKMSDAKIRFRLENQENLFLEKIGFSWCGGTVETGSITLTPDMEDLKTTLYCDRLGFSELLSQFGIEDTEGQGSLNGRLPIEISSNAILFDDGFLFSTPGNSGIVRFNNTEQLRQGMPGIEGTPYLDYSMKSLENFSYNWTKLTFNTVGKELLVAMQLDGKPAEPLPFGYKKGQIIATDKGSGIQHPIRLDVNFRLPLQDMFHYGKNFQSIMENL